MHETFGLLFAHGGSIVTHSNPSTSSTPRVPMGLVELRVSVAFTSV